MNIKEGKPLTPASDVHYLVIDISFEGVSCMCVLYVGRALHTNSKASSSIRRRSEYRHQSLPTSDNTCMICWAIIMHWADYSIQKQSLICVEPLSLNVSANGIRRKKSRQTIHASLYLNRKSMDAIYSGISEKICSLKTWCLNRIKIVGYIYVCIIISITTDNSNDWNNDGNYMH